MIIDFHEAQIQKFVELADLIQQDPEHYVQFEHVSDFYKTDWLNDFPLGTTWYISGLDDGAESFYASIQYANYHLNIQSGASCNAILVKVD